MSDLDHLYSLIDLLRQRCGGERRLAECDGRMGWPQRGVYFFFEDGELRQNAQPRVVRVGTHALTERSSTTLWHRLSQHRGNIGGSRPGGGNHRGSIFRLHVGQCLLAQDGDASDATQTWGVGASATGTVRDVEHAHERAVSTYIGQMPFLWLEVDDPPGPTSDRAAIEAGVIALLSRRSNPAADSPSPHWLGRRSTRDTIRESGLWNVRHVDGPQTDVLPLLQRCIEQFSRGRNNAPGP